MALPTVKRIRHQLYHDLGDPAGGDGEPRLPLQVRRARHPARARAAPASRCRRCRPTRRGCGTTGSATSTRTCSATARWPASIKGKRVLITGASSGIGLETALKVGEAGGEVLLVSRTREKLEEVAKQVRGGRRRSRTCTRPTCRTSTTSTGWPQEVLEQHGGVDVLINNAGRSIRRSVERSYDRFHDYERTMQLNYFGALKLILAFLPGMRERKSGHIINVSLDRRADEHAALLRLRGVEVGARRVLALHGARGAWPTTSSSRRSTCRSCARR